MKNIKDARLWFTIARKLVPIVIDAIESVTAARRADSDGGRKITPDERADIAAEVADQIRPIVVDVVMGEIRG